MRCFSKSLYSRLFAGIHLGLALGALSPGEATAQLLYSFETGLDGFVRNTGGTSDYISHQQSTTGVTLGSFALEVETGPSFGFDVKVDANAGNIGLWNTATANPDSYTFDFDLTIPKSSWDVLGTTGNFFSVQTMFIDSSSHQVTSNVGVVPGQAFAGTVSIPVSEIGLVTGSSFYQVNIGNNSNFTLGGGGEGLKYYIDNVRFTKEPIFTEEVLFSWETPDNPATTGVNEQFEGWDNLYAVNVASTAPHLQSISTTQGVTEGNASFALTAQAPGTFSWGSQFLLNSDTDPDPEVTVIDPVVQLQVDDFIGKFNAADKVAFDVTLSDPPADIINQGFQVQFHVGDSTDRFFRAPSTILVGGTVNNAGETVTVEIPLDSLVTGSGEMQQSFSEIGLEAGTEFQILIASNVSGEADFFIDNFRLITEVVGLPGDYNGDGTVNLADYTVWRDNLGANESTLANPGDGSGTVDTGDYDVWKSNFGTSGAGSASLLAGTSRVPEPGQLTHAILGSMCGLLVLRKRRQIVELLS